MNNVIEFKKDCIMKTMVAEITDITISHDYKILDDMIDGYFDVSGEYKITTASVTKEEFMYTIPFSIAISSLIDKDTINLSIEDFQYEIDKDVLHLNMKLNMEYEELKEEIAIEEEPNLMNEVDEMLNTLNTEEEYHNELMNDYEINESEVEEKIDLKDKEEAENSMNEIMSKIDTTDNYYKYKVYIMRQEDTIESIAIKYNVTLDNLREYNDIENIQMGDKIVIPYIDEED